MKEMLIKEELGENKNSTEVIIQPTSIQSTPVTCVCSAVDEG